MADCGDSGSALDRTARAFLSGNREAAKQVASVMGHALAHTPGAVRPLATPDRIVLPSAATTTTTTTTNTTRLDDVATMQQQQAVTARPSPQLAASHHHHHYQQQQHPWNAMPPPAAPLQHHHQRHPHPPLHLSPHLQMAAAVQQQHHQMMVVQQQQMQMQFMIQQQQLQQQQQQQQQQQAPKQQSLLDQWHEGLEQQVQDELREHLESLQKQQQQDQASRSSVGHEGIVHGATMEELAAAWAEAQADYERTVEETTNLWSGAEEQQEEELAVYEFINKKNELMADKTTTTTSTTTSTTSSFEQPNWMEEGMREFHAGNLKEAIRAFEMELQYNSADNATAWRMLGQCHAENDMDQQAILCLEQAVDRDPYSPEALLALGVSYVNELNHNRALDNLKAWITHNPQFAGLELDDDVYGATTTTTAATDGQNMYESPIESAFDDVQRLLLRALDYAPSDAADVLEALGVVYNVSRDYTAAADAFRKAIELRPDDYQLWNKLGATLANGNKSEEALPAYHKALQLKPKYARAWLNMAISHSNLQNYDEAARCYLQTISLNPTAVHCWSYLRIALSCSERWDLIPIVAAQDLKAFQEHFDFVLY